jgi:large subunit ribosomal protein L17
MNKKLSRKTDHRDHLLRNLLTSLVLYEKVDTTKSKSKILKSNFDRLIARNKKADLTARRSLFQILYDKKAVLKVIEELIPRYKTRNGGYVRSYNLKARVGDSAPMTRLELVDKKVFVGDLTKEKAKTEQINQPLVNENKQVETGNEKKTNEKK